jgi:hypothetical protein
MNEIKIAELIHFNNQFYTGGLRDTVYRCSLVGPFALSLCTEEEEKEFIGALYQWFDIVDEHNIDLTESAIEIYTDGKIQGKSLDLYDNYPAYFERIISFIMGKEEWCPSSKEHAEAVSRSHEITAQTLNNIYSK